MPASTHQCVESDVILEAGKPGDCRRAAEQRDDPLRLGDAAALDLRESACMHSAGCRHTQLHRALNDDLSKVNFAACSTQCCNGSDSLTRMNAMRSGVGRSCCAATILNSSRSMSSSERSPTEKEVNPVDFAQLAEDLRHLHA
jgi:hypothetical protein